MSERRASTLSSSVGSVNSARGVGGTTGGGPHPTTDMDAEYAEQASTEMFSGPTSESVPSSYSLHTGHHHHHHGHGHGHGHGGNATRGRRRSRRDSEASLIYGQPGPAAGVVSSYGEDIDNETHSHYVHKNRDRSESRSSFRFFSIDELESGAKASTDVFDGEEDPFEGADIVEPMPFSDRQRRATDSSIASIPRRRESGTSMRRRSSAYYEPSVVEPLLNAEGRDEQPQGISLSDVYSESRELYQSYYIAEEDLVIGIAGFRTSKLRTVLYYTLCIGTLGLAYLVLRWFPRLRIACVGRPMPLGQCDWVVVENQWGELHIEDVAQHIYGKSLASVFGDSEEYTTESSSNETADSSVEQTDGNEPLNSNNDRAEDDANGRNQSREASVTSTPSSNAQSTLSSLPQSLYFEMMPVLRYIEYRHMRFLYHPQKDMYIANNQWADAEWEHTFSKGLNSETQADRMLVFGPNMIEIGEKSTWQLLVDEVLHPFYMFQVFSILLWAFDEYYYYASCIFFISVISVGNALVETKQTLSRLREISKFECDVRVLRNGFWVTISSSELVPGDIYEISDPDIPVFPCDSILLSGDCIVNESMLTGESVPVSKSPMTQRGVNAIRNLTDEDLGKHALYGGTKIVRVRRSESEALEGHEYRLALAMVLRTGFSTTKGSLVRSMLFPKPSGFKFYRDSFRYVGVMAIVAVLGFTVSTVNFIRMHLATHLIVLRALDLVTIVIPPALPATLTIGTNFSLSRLRQKFIYCISPSKVNVGGKIDIMCFDKTGTLTEDGLDVLGVHIVDDKNEFSELMRNSQEVPIKLGEKAMEAMSTCHSLRRVDGELVGDPLDGKMFDFTGWTFREGHEFHENSAIEGDDGNGHKADRTSISSDGSRYLHVVKMFEFVSQLRRMSVVVKYGSRTHVYLKGAPEVMQQICDSSTFPSNYKDVLHHYTHCGYRVIALATRVLRPNESVEDMSRDDCEGGMQFLGFIIFENKIKPGTGRVIQELNLAKIRTVMCTGDNILTAISVGRECHMIQDDQIVFAPRFVDLDEAVLDHERDGIVQDWLESEEKEIVRWECIDDRAIVLNAQLRPMDQHLAGDSRYVLAVTGDVFRYYLREGSIDQIEQILMYGAIYARMSPEEKHELVEQLQRIDYTAGFCGDGANDCAALKTADVGISLSEAEASVAAPFTSRIFDISCVLDVIKEGRCALTTSFSCFKYMSLYSAIQFVSVSILYGQGSNLGDFQFLWIDLFLILPIAVLMAWSGPYPKLRAKRPTANLVSRKVLVGLLGQVIVLAAVQFAIWFLVRKEPWYVPPLRGGEDSEVASSDNMVLFVTSSFEYIFVALILSVGPPFREPMIKNVPFLLAVVSSTGLTTLLLFTNPNSSIGNLMDLSPLSNAFRGLVLAISVVGFLASWVAYVYICPIAAQMLFRLMRAMGYIKKRKRYKILRERFIE